MLNEVSEIEDFSCKIKLFKDEGEARMRFAERIEELKESNASDKSEIVENEGYFYIGINFNINYIELTLSEVNFDEEIVIY